MALVTTAVGPLLRETGDGRLVPVELLWNGDGPPADALGSDGDSYLDVSARELWGPKAAGTWAGTGPWSLIGPAGDPGPEGDPGPAGDDGRTIHPTNGRPSDALGADGDFAIDPAGVLYGPKNGGVWPAGVSLIGPPGDDGRPGGVVAVNGQSGEVTLDASDVGAADASATSAALAAKADLVGGFVPTSQIPALAITRVSVVASEAAQLALTAQEGDVAVRTDERGKPYIRNGGSAGTIADWTPIDATPAVASVNGQSGTVVLAAADVSALPSSDGAVAARHLAAALKPSGSAGVGDEALRRLGTGAGEAAPGSLAVTAAGSASNPHTNPAAVRNTALATNWWKTSTEPTNRASGDLWVRTA